MFFVANIFFTQMAVSDFYEKLLKQKYVRMGECALSCSVTLRSKTCAVWNVASFDVKLKFGAPLSYCLFFNVIVIKYASSY